MSNPGNHRGVQVNPFGCKSRENMSDESGHKGTQRHTSAVTEHPSQNVVLESNSSHSMHCNSSSLDILNYSEQDY